jgi:hypothetical protein
LAVAVVAAVVTGVTVAGRLAAGGFGVVAAGFGADAFGAAVDDAVEPVPDDPTAVVRARVTFGFGLTAGWSGVVEVGVGSGGVVGSAMRLA